MGPQLLHTTQEEGGRMATTLSRALRSLVVGPLLLKGISLRENPGVAVVERVNLLRMVL